MKNEKQPPIRLNLASFVEVSGLSKPRIYAAVEEGQLARNQDGTFTVSGRRNRKFLRELGIDPEKIGVAVCCALKKRNASQYLEGGASCPASQGEHDKRDECVNRFCE
ncbi:MAG: hypothetical protein QM472_07870, partial [Spirochaetota bacterium]|nr:hypothetical protein [Spirochaetota bacterium]